MPISSTIRIIKDKEAIYIGQNALNFAARAGIATGVQLLKSGLYTAVVPKYYPYAKKSDAGQYLTYANNIADVDFFDFSLKTGNATVSFLNAKINVSLQNTIKETVVAGRRGTVKEFIQAQDYSIEVTGDIITDPKSEESQFEYPLRELQEAVRLLSIDSNIEIANRYVNDVFDVTKVVVKSMMFDHQRGLYINAVPFKLSMVSDSDYDFLVSNS